VDLKIDPEPVKVKVVMASQLGNCWLPARFIEGATCGRVEKCTYPEKKTCKAVDTEIKLLEDQLQTLTKRHVDKIMELKAMKDPK
jgi:hypothetical protein